MRRFIILLLTALLVAIVPVDAAPQKKQGASRRAKTEQSAKQGKKKSTNTARKGGKTTSQKGKKANGNRSSKDVRNEKRNIEQKLRQTSTQLKANAEETARKLSQLNLVEGQIGEVNGRIDLISGRLDSINREVATLTDSITAMDNHLHQITATYIKAIKRSQGRRQNMSALAFIFSSDSFSQAYRRMRYLKQFAKWREKRAGEINEARRALNARKERMAALAKEAAASKTQLSGERASLVRKQNETKNLVGELRQQGSALQEVMRQQRERANALERELEAVIAREAAKAEAARKAEQERLRRIEEEKARKAAEAEAARQAEEAEKARQAAEAEEKRKAQEAARAEAARKAAAEEAARKEAQAEAARKEAEKARREARQKAEKEAAELKARKAAEAKKQAEEARKAAAKAEEDARRAVKEREQAEERRKQEEKKKAKAVKHKRKQQEAASQASNAPEASPLHTPAHSSQSGTASGKVEQGADFATLKGRLPYPIVGNYTIVKRFGRQQHPSLPHVMTDNAGIDIETAKGAAVRTVCDGEVSAVFRPDGYNAVVVIRHGSYMTVYANLGNVSVSTGQKVKAGQGIGSVFSDPKDGGRSVLHFEVRNGRIKENPESWLR